MKAFLKKGDYLLRFRRTGSGLRLEAKANELVEKMIAIMPPDMGSFEIGKLLGIVVRGQI